MISNDRNYFKFILLIHDDLITRRIPLRFLDRVGDLDAKIEPKCRNARQLDGIDPFHFIVSRMVLRMRAVEEEEERHPLRGNIALI